MLVSNVLTLRINRTKKEIRLKKKLCLPHQHIQQANLNFRNQCANIHISKCRNINLPCTRCYQEQEQSHKIPFSKRKDETFRRKEIKSDQPNFPFTQTDSQPKPPTEPKIKEDKMNSDPCPQNPIFARNRQRDHAIPPPTTRDPTNIQTTEYEKYIRKTRNRKRRRRERERDTGGEGPGESGDLEVGGGAGSPQQPGGGHGHDRTTRSRRNGLELDYCSSPPRRRTLSVSLSLL